MGKYFINNKKAQAILYGDDFSPSKILINGEELTNLNFRDTIKGSESNSITYSSEYKKNLLNLSFEGVTEEQTITPTPNEPQPIENASNISVTLSGINLLDISSVVVTNNTAFDITNDTIVFAPTQKNSRFRYIVKVEIGKQYTISVGDVFNSDTTNIALNRLPVGNTANYDSAEYGFVTKDKPLTITATTEDLYLDGYVCYKPIGVQKHTLVKPMVVEGTVAKPYEPYLRSLVNTDLTLNKIDFVFNSIQNTAKDIFSLDYIQKNAVLKKNIADYNLGDLADADFEPISSTNQNYVIFAIKNLKRGLRASNNFGYGYCNRCKWQTEANPVITEGKISIGVHSGTELWLYISTSLIPYTTSGGYYDSTVADLRAFLTQYPINICYVMNSEENIPVTDAWVNDLLNLPTTNGTNTITINGDINPTNTSITYAEWGGKYEA